MTLRLALVALVACSITSSPTARADNGLTRTAQKKGGAKKGDKKPAPAKTKTRLDASVAPFKGKAVSSHAPYEAGECELCHTSNNAKNPGKLSMPLAEVCVQCHDDLLEKKYKHRAAVEACTSCHNPHSSGSETLLQKPVEELCVTCHENIKQASAEALVKHGALSRDKKCLNCHNPHSTDVEKLLVQLPFELCLSCHGEKKITTDEDGKELQNIKQLLADKKVHHAPVEAGDCAACHRPHGSPYFRMLDSDYPASFYTEWDPKSYGLCFQCHDEEVFSQEKTTTLTGFRDGSKNLHFVHVSKKSRGRTCRACHEVHAADQGFQIRDGVPYGKKGWVLKLHYTQAANGGSCEKTCHEKRSYKNKGK